ncbi:RHS repeat protein [Culturomica massiliensis]|uniref:RHS repeat protein n=1 Tax=Culturomica massiliensis TaxID=1841857 RepID=UPI000837C1C5|nr:RHS repeat domain-containing protein [Culturomica massiliensis]
MKKLVLYLGLWAISLGSSGQATELPQTSNLSVIPPTPEAAALIRFVEYPVSYYTGVPEISVPLYTVKSREISFPVSLNYHASGIKVEDVSGFVGLGWSLNAGGVISRVAHGSLSGQSVDIRDRDSVVAANDIRYLKYVANDITNASLDRYYYNFCGISGSFVIQSDGTIVQIPETENRIERISALSPLPGVPDKDFKITTPDGMMYYFHNREYIVSSGGDYTGSSWYLSKIVSFNRTDTVSFNYSTEESWSKTTLGTALAATVKYVILVHENPKHADTSYMSLRLDKYTRYEKCQLLTDIRFNGHKIVYSYAADRTDTGLKKRLKGIDLYANDVLLQRVNLGNESYFPDGRMKLSKVEMLDKNGNKTDAYAFKYVNESTALIGNGYAQDLFGFYNGKNNMTLNVVLDNGTRSRHRDYVFPEASYYTLNEIGRIAGGYTRFTYEPGIYESADRQLKIGIRVAKIEDYDGGVSAVKSRVYTYENAVPTSMVDPYDLRNYLIQTGYNSFTYIIPGSPEPVRQTNTYYSSSRIPGVPVEDTRIYYSKVTETVTGNNSLEVLRNIYEYDPNNLKNITRIFGAQQSTGTSEHGIYRYIGSEAPSDRFRPRYFSSHTLESNWAAGNLLKKTVYKQENGTFVPVECVTNTYQKYNERYIPVSLFSRSMIYLRDENAHPYDIFPHTHFSDFFFFNVYVRTGCSRLKSTTTERYFGNTLMTESLVYEYNSLDYPARSGDNMQVRKQTYSVGDKNYIRRFYYPADYPANTYTFMCARNNILPVVKEELEVNGTTASVQNTYSSLTLGGTSQVKQTGSVSMLNGVETGRQGISYDEHGNPACLTKPGEPTVCYLWGYSGSYPVAEIKNAAYSAVVSAMGGEAVVKAMAKAIVLSANDITKLNALRTALPQAEVSVYIYNPLIGVTSVTDPSGRKVSYEYDNAGRLQRMTDDDGNPLQKYEYMIKGQ